MTNSAKQQPSAQRGQRQELSEQKALMRLGDLFNLAVMSGACTRGAVSCRTSLGSHLTFIRQAASQTSTIRVALFLQRKRKKN